MGTSEGPRLFARPFCNMLKKQFEKDERRTVDELGHIKETANPMAKQMAGDLGLFEQVEAARPFFEEWELEGGSWKAIFDDGPVKEQFLLMDTASLRRQCVNDAFEEAPTKEIEKPEVLEEFVCGLTDAEGNVCAALFETKQALVTHQLFAAGGQHGVPALAFTATVNNQCVWCRSCFASKRIARMHLQISMESGRCVVDLSAQPWPVEQPSDLDCPFCDFSAQHLAQLLEHIREHAPPNEAHFFTIDGGPPPCHAEGAPNELAKRLVENWRRRQAEKERRYQESLKDFGRQAQGGGHRLGGHGRGDTEGHGIERTGGERSCGTALGTSAEEGRLVEGEGGSLAKDVDESFVGGVATDTRTERDRDDGVRGPDDVAVDSRHQKPDEVLQRETKGGKDSPRAAAHLRFPGASSGADASGRHDRGDKTCLEAVHGGDGGGNGGTSGKEHQILQGGEVLRPGQQQARPGGRPPRRGFRGAGKGDHGQRRQEEERSRTEGPLGAGAGGMVGDAGLSGPFSECETRFLESEQVARTWSGGSSGQNRSVSKAPFAVPPSGFHRVPPPPVCRRSQVVLLLKFIGCFAWLLLHVRGPQHDRIPPPLGLWSYAA